MTIRHSAYEAEQERLDQTMQVIEKEIAQIKEDIKAPTDDHVKQIVNAAKAKELSHLERSRLKPYFGRVDFVNEEDYESHLDRVYIGKRGVVRSDNFESVVVDWRAPIASLYYSGESQDAYYRTPQGIVRGEVKLKRNFAIENGKITGIYDGALKETINREMAAPDEFLDEGYIDEFLAASLDQTNDSRLKDIVATIQSEQNDIIRAEKNVPLIVQGVAGSGKTTIALHRLSYLIYNYQDSMASKRFMVFAPNRLFLTYISEVLPELGVEDVQQSTFLDWGARLVKPHLPKGWRILDPNKALQLFFEGDETNGRERERAAHRMSFKGSLACKMTLDNYLRDVLDRQIPYKKLSFIYNKTQHVFAIEGTEIKQLFLQQYAHLPYHERLVTVRKHLKQQMNKLVYAHLRERRIDLDKPALAKFEKKIEQILEQYLAAWPALDVFSAYQTIFSDEQMLRKLAPSHVSDTIISAVCATSGEIFAAERIESEDIAPLLYLRYLIYGIDQAGMFDHAVVDEAQDLSALEIMIISMQTKLQSVTIVGDIAQGIHSYRGLLGWAELSDGVFAGKSVPFFKLEQSYRSTVEIMNCANRVLEKVEIPELFLAKPVLRHGEKPLLLQSKDADEQIAEIASQVKGLQAEGFVSISIVAKSMAQCKVIHKKLKSHLAGMYLLGTKDTEFPDGVTIMPAYLTKGLQFDAVILVDVDEHHYQASEADAKLLYVAMTRPVHRLIISCRAAFSPLLSGMEDAADLR